MVKIIDRWRFNRVINILTLYDQWRIKESPKNLKEESREKNLKQNKKLTLYTGV